MTPYQPASERNTPERIATRGGHLWSTDGICNHCGADANEAVRDALRYRAIKESMDYGAYEAWVDGFGGRHVVYLGGVHNHYGDSWEEALDAAIAANEGERNG